MVTGVDVVREQVLVAAGAPLSFRQDEILLRGHAIECRINAEDVASGFLPSPGRITAYREPGGIGVRVDSGVTAGDEVSDLYDPLVAKVLAHDVDRERARARMLRALEEFVIEGPTTLLGFHRALLASPCFIRGETCRGVVESDELADRAQELEQQAHDRLGHAEPARSPAPHVDPSLPHLKTRLATSSDGAASRTRGRVVDVELDGRLHHVRIHAPEPAWAELARRHALRASERSGVSSDAVISPMQGTVLQVEVGEGDQIEAGAVVCVVEAMKMENPIVAHRSGIVTGLAVATGDQVQSGQLICTVAPET
jgi:acetyl-CoA/propionyl-CoA carboxylase, biotin carboxylase, biotin carboxyl carrier protein